MSLSILNNVSALYAQNSLNSTQASLQNTLKQLSSGSRINSGADDAAGLAISDGLHANEAALTQSAQNATAGIGLLQTADGALSQVTNLLDRAVTLATESANGTLTKGQVSSANQEYQNILAQIGNIGATTNFNSSQVFSSSATNIVVTDGTSSGLNTYADTIGALTRSSVGTTEAAPVTTSSIAPTSTTTPAGATSNTAGVYTFTPNAGSDKLSGKVSFAVGSGTQASVTVAAGTTLTQLKDQLNGTNSFSTAGLTATLNTGGTALVITGPTTGANAAANTVSFAGTSLNDTVSSSLTVTNGVTAAPPTQTASSLAFTGTGVAATDSLAGKITYQIGGSTAQSFTLAANSTLNSGANTDVAYQLNHDSTFQGYGLTASASGTTLTILGPTGNNEAITLGTGTGATAVQDTTHSGIVAGTTVGHAGTAGTYTLTALSGSGNVLSGSLSVNGESIAGPSGAALQTAVNTNVNLIAAGVTASFDSGTKVLTITGNPASGTAPVIGASSLQDSGSGAVAALSGTAAVPPTVGTSTLAAFSSGTGGVLGGTITIGSSDIGITANSTGNSVANQINAAMLSAGSGITSSFDAATMVLTISGKADGTGLPAINASALTDSGNGTYTGAPTPGVAAHAATAGTSTMSIGGTDVLSGDITINGVHVTGATSGATLATAIGTAGTAAGITASYDSNTSLLTITGSPVTGAALNITSNNIHDSATGSVATTAVIAAVAGTKTTSTLAVGGNAVASDVLTGNVNYTDSSNGALNTFAIAAGTTLDNNATTGLSTRLNNDQTFSGLGLTASVSGTTLTIKGPAGSTNTVALGAGTLSDVTNNIVGAATNNSVLGSTGTSATKVLTLNNASDSFGGSININSNGLGNVAVSLAGLNGQQAALAITNNATLAGQGVSAAWSSSNKQLTITGNGTGTSLAVNPVTNLSDNSTVSGATGTVQASGGASTGATSTIQLGSANDTVSGNLRLVVGNSGLAKDTVSFAIAANTTGAALASQINGNSSFRAAGVSAAYNSSTFAVTLTGPTGTTNTLDASGSSLTDSTSAVPQGGADFTTDAVKELTHDTAAAVLINVTAAVADVAYQRGTIGADINQLTSASNVASSEQVNLTSAEESIRATNYGQAASDLSKYQILSQTGISALAQANSVQQEVLKLLQ